MMGAGVASRVTSQRVIAAAAMMTSYAATGTAMSEVTIPFAMAYSACTAKRSAVAAHTQPMVTIARPVRIVDAATPAMTAGAMSRPASPVSDANVRGTERARAIWPAIAMFQRRMIAETRRWAGARSSFIG